MKLKYYLRGLGIGVIVTAFLMGYALSAESGSAAMSDAQVRERALELGMVDAEAGVLADDLGQDTEEDTAVSADTVAADNADANEGTQTEEKDADTDAAAAEEADDAQTTEKADGDTEADADTEADVVTVITVQSGDGSRSVANKLQEAGVIDDAAAFDTYLCKNGYDKRIAAGDHEIPAGATNQEIAEALTR